uniref:Uncharacterized protein n=1 Tax=Romanomermis culicivorax TaxID=13658 RepID=A0A915J7W1_ROMCU
MRLGTVSAIPTAQTESKTTFNLGRENFIKNIRETGDPLLISLIFMRNDIFDDFVNLIIHRSHCTEKKTIQYE